MVAKVLIAIDLAESSNKVLKAGKGIANTYGADCEVIHCMEPYIQHLGDITLPQVMPDLLEVKQELLPYFESMAQTHGIDKQHIHIEFGHAAETILAKAKKESFDLIVLGSHGKHGVRLLLGSTCNKVLHHAHCDVLAVRISD